MQNIFLVFIGGGLGAVLRYIITTQAAARLSGLFPWGTLIVNAVGSLLMGFIIGVLINRAYSLGESARLLLAVGFLGGFTTFSSFSMETMTLIKGDSVLLAVLNIGANTLFGLIAAWLGLYLAKLLG